MHTETKLYHSTTTVLQEISHNTSDQTPGFRTGQWLMPCSFCWFSLWYEPAVPCVLQPMRVQVPGDGKTTHSQIILTRSASWADDVTLILSRISTCCPDAGEAREQPRAPSLLRKDKIKCTAMLRAIWKYCGFMRLVEYEQKFKEIFTSVDHGVFVNMRFKRLHIGDVSAVKLSCVPILKTKSFLIIPLSNFKL